MAIILTLAANARSSVPTEHPGKISSGPTGVPGITGHTICRTLMIMTISPLRRFNDVVAVSLAFSQRNNIYIPLSFLLCHVGMLLIIIVEVHCFVVVGHDFFSQYTTCT